MDRLRGRQLFLLISLISLMSLMSLLKLLKLLKLRVDIQRELMRIDMQGPPQP